MTWRCGGAGIIRRDHEVLASTGFSPPSIRAGPAQRARFVLMAADGAGAHEIVTTRNPAC